MQILIIGGTGLVGGHAALFLESNGHKVTIAGRNPPTTVPQLAKLPFLRGDYTKGDFKQANFVGFEAVVFAAGSDVRHVPEGEEPGQYFLRANGTVIPAVARLARDAGVKHFIHIGSFYHRIAPELVAENSYIRSRKLAADGVCSLARPDFYACSLDAPFIVGTVPGMQVPMFVAYTQYAEGKLGIPPFAPTGSTNFISAQSLSEAILGALSNGPQVSGKGFLVGDENLAFTEYFGLFFKAVGSDLSVLASENDHPLMPSVTLFTKGREIRYEPDEEEWGLLGKYGRNNIGRAVTEIVSQYKSDSIEV